MAELDDLLTRRVSDEAAERASTPPFATIQRRGVRRRRERRAAMLTCAAVATVVAVAGVQLAEGSGTRMPVDVPRPAPTSPPKPGEPMTAAEVVDHPDARLQRIVVAPDEPDARAALWQVCGNPDCTRSRQAVAVTGDGFETRSEIAVPGHAYPLITPLDDDSFYVGWNRRNQFVVHADGSTVPVHVVDAVPTGDAARVVRTPSLRSPFTMLDPATAAGYPLATPEGVHQLVSLPDLTMLSAVSDRPGEGAAVWWSPDDRAWHQEALPVLDHPLFMPVPSSRSDVLALVEGADGATLFPLLQIHRSLDGGATWETIDMRTDPMAYLGTSAVLPDGRLLVDIAAWSDQRINRPSAQPVGLYVSDGLDWSALTPVDVGEPFMTGNGDERDLELMSMQADGAGVTVFARRIIDADAEHTVHVSRDAGLTWSEVAAR